MEQHGSSAKNSYQYTKNSGIIDIFRLFRRRLCLITVVHPDRPPRAVVIGVAGDVPRSVVGSFKVTHIFQDYLKL
jgi:hypothetical protein